MATKKGAGGRQQNYNPHTGRYTKTDYSILVPQPTRKEKAQKREKLRRETLYNRAKNSKDPYIFDLYQEIEQALPGTVIAINVEKFDPLINNTREFDIVTKKCIIEVKSGKKFKNGLKQFLSQQRYATLKKKNHVVFAPNIPTMSKITYEKSGIKIIKDYKSLINTIKEYEK